MVSCVLMLPVIVTSIVGKGRCRVFVNVHYYHYCIYCLGRASHQHVYIFHMTIQYGAANRISQWTSWILGGGKVVIVLVGGCIVSWPR